MIDEGGHQRRAAAPPEHPHPFAEGGVGLLLCRWAKHLGATVIGTVGSEEKAELAVETLTLEAPVVAMLRNGEAVTTALAGQDVFVAVGALHVVGEDGLEALFGDAGYRVARIH